MAGLESAWEVAGSVTAGFSSAGSSFVGGSSDLVTWGIFFLLSLGEEDILEVDCGGMLAGLEETAAIMGGDVAGWTRMAQKRFGPFTCRLSHELGGSEREEGRGLASKGSSWTIDRTRNKQAKERGSARSGSGLCLPLAFLSAIDKPDKQVGRRDGVCVVDCGW